MNAVLDRALPRVVAMPSGCWHWTGANHGDDRRARLIVEGRLDYAYRVLYVEMVGQIPKGLTLDHLCRNPECVNPTHLEPVTAAENTRRAHVLAETCRSGRHPISEMRDRPGGKRQCGACHRESERARLNAKPRGDGLGYRRPVRIGA